MPAKKPQDHKSKPKPYVHTLEDGRTVRFKPFSQVPFGLFRSVRNMDEVDVIFAFVDWACSKKDQDLLDELPAEEVHEAIAAWQADSEVSAGES